ncbi:hypothetical protein PUNSTDRAFT_85763, partial [Punctularia strigosozonata HHB-11173 SS5]|uniref:uncharacterized protein n=1 Tax=Punctularia strigosozonata (strain HHB-11173) TaxID=741275 RepID=UPI000441717A
MVYASLPVAVDDIKDQSNARNSELIVELTAPAYTESPVIKSALLELEQATRARQHACANRPASPIEEQRRISSLMRQVGEAQSDPRVAEEWDVKEREFESGNRASRESILSDLSKGFTIIVASPILIAGGCVYGAGLILYGTGKLITGLGHIFTGGTLRGEVLQPSPWWTPHVVGPPQGPWCSNHIRHLLTGTYLLHRVGRLYAIREDFWCRVFDMSH